jgi:hypothetical protein
MSVDFEAGPNSRIAFTLTAEGHGSTPSTALDNARNNARIECGSKIIDRYLDTHRDVDSAMSSELAVACVNLDCE